MRVVDEIAISQCMCVTVRYIVPDNFAPPPSSVSVPVGVALIATSRHTFRCTFNLLTVSVWVGLISGW